jgi:hypothetical protein
LNEKIRKWELGLFIVLFYTLSLLLIFFGCRFAITMEARVSLLPVVFTGFWAVLVGAVYVLSGAAILFSSWAMWRIFR